MPLPVESKDIGTIWSSLPGLCSTELLPGAWGQCASAGRQGLVLLTMPRNGAAGSWRYVSLSPSTR